MYPTQIKGRLCFWVTSSHSFWHSPDRCRDGSIVGWWMFNLVNSLGWSQRSIWHQTNPNALCCSSLKFHVLTHLGYCISLCKMSEGWTENTAVSALPLYWCKWQCKVKGKGKLYTLGQVVGLHAQHWLITDINSLINSSEIIIRSQAFCLCYNKSKKSKKTEIRSVCFCVSVYKHTKTYPHRGGRREA